MSMRQCFGCKQLLTKRSQVKFCSHSCSATYTNIKRGVTRYCAFCNEELPQRRSRAKFCNPKCAGSYRRQEIFKRIEDGDTSLWQGAYRRYLVHKYGAKCMKCGWAKKNTTTGKVPVQLNHKDGNSNNNQLSNHELLCPNCHSLTPSFGALNMGKGRERRRVRYKTNAEMVQLAQNVTPVK